MGAAHVFNSSRFGQWINSRPGRLFKLSAGVAFVGLGVSLAAAGSGGWAAAALVWSVLPLTAALADVCWISAALGGPLRSSACAAAGTTQRTRS